VPNFFEASVNKDIEGSPRLVVTLANGSFTGKALAYFNSSLLESESKTFSKMPLDVGETLAVSVGYLDPADHSKVAEEHIGIRASSIGTSGKLMLEVSLVQEEINAGFKGARAKLCGRFLATYGQLGDLALGLAALARGEVDKVRFDEWTG
jgi:hypothetical protein